MIYKDIGNKFGGQYQDLGIYGCNYFTKTEFFYFESKGNRLDEKDKPIVDISE